MPTHSKSAIKPWLCMLALLLALSPCRSYAQTSSDTNPVSVATPALVTFFTNGFSLLGGLPGQKSEGFRGRLFVENDQLAFMHGPRFITISFVPGTYQFTATTWMASGPAGGAHLNLDLAAGLHYYVELRTRQSAPITALFGIKEVPCQDAFKDHAQDKPLEPADLQAAGKSNLIAETSFPACSSASASEQQLIKPENQETSIEGTIRLIHGFGPPGYGEDPKHDAHVSYWALEVPVPINTPCTPESEFGCDPAKRLKLFFPNMALEPLNDQPAAKWKDQAVMILGKLRHADTAGEMTSLYIDVTTISAALDQKVQNR